LLQGADKIKAGKDGATPLCCVAQQDHLTGMKDLVEPGADKNKTTNRYSSLPTNCEVCHLKVVPHLVQNGADKKRAISQARLLSAQQLIVLYLVQQGADKNKATNNDVTSLIIAALRGHLDMLATPANCRMSS
jgi:ankyrin repeat protein